MLRLRLRLRLRLLLCAPAAHMCLGSPGRGLLVLLVRASPAPALDRLLEYNVLEEELLLLLLPGLAIPIAVLWVGEELGLLLVDGGVLLPDPREEVQNLDFGLLGDVTIILRRAWGRNVGGAAKREGATDAPLFGEAPCFQTLPTPKDQAEGELRAPQGHSGGAGI